MRKLRLIAVGAAGALLAGMLLFLSGVVDIASSSRQTGFADWLWGLAVRQSVTFSSIGIEVPALDDPALIRRGAGHYDLVCAACHGSPARPPEAFAAGLTPPAPRLVEQMEAWRPPARIFWTVKHGIRHSAMPAWPTQLRDDEVWAVVAFLLAMPGLSAAAYTELADSENVSTCSRCHGDGGSDGNNAFPRLDIQSPDYIADALRAFRDRSRASGTMITAANGLTDAEVADLAGFYGRLGESPAAGDGPGGDIARLGIPERNVPPCEACHGATGRKEFPRLAGQSSEYILNQLRLFASLGTDRGGRYADIMATAIGGVTEAEMASVADWYAGAE